MLCGVQVPCSEIVLRLLVIGLSNGAIIALNAIAVTLVYGAVRTLNFAHGDLFALTSVIVATVIGRLGLHAGMGTVPLFAGLVIALGVGIGFGAALNIVIERIAFRPFRSNSRLAPLIAGIALSFVFFQIALLWRKTEASFIPGEHRSVPGIPEFPRERIPDLLPNWNLAASTSMKITFALNDLLVLAIAAMLALLVSLFLARTRTGQALRACAQDPELAQLCGVNHTSAIRLAFGLGGALAGAAAFVFTLYYSHPFATYGVQSGLTAFVAAVLGGIGVPAGAFLSGLLLGVLAAFSDYFLSARWTPVLTLAILMALLTLRPGGLAVRAFGAESPSTPIVDIVAGYTRLRKTSYRRWAGYGMIILGLVYPAIDILFALHLQVIATGILVFALMAIGLNLLLGYAGLLDLGYAACFAIGGYTAALLTSMSGPLFSILPQPLEFMAVLAISALAAGIFGALNGMLTLRLHGEGLAIATLAFGQIVPRVMLNLDQWTSGARGIAALPPPYVLGQPLVTPVARYYLALILVALAALISQRLTDSRAGRAWRAMAEDETAAISSGISPVRARLPAFAISAAYAGIAGALFASVFSYMDPDQTDFRLSAMTLAMVVIGGAGSVPGVILGAILVSSYDQIIIPGLGAWIESATPQGSLWRAIFDLRALSFLSFGVALYLTVLFRAGRGETKQ